jgi:LAGLIDADG endonuclease
MISKYKASYEQFFLGLLEGDGSMQVNHWKKRYLQFRIVIKLKYTTANYDMCANIRQSLNVMNLHIRHGFIVMVEDDRKKLPKIMAIIDKYGLLLTHKRKQYTFFKYCLRNHISYSEYAHIKDLKDLWSGFEGIVDYSSTELLQFKHWPNWLCGFTEAEGCFCIRLNNCHSFSIAQKEGYEVLTAIKNTFSIPNKVRSSTRMYYLETYAGRALQGLVNFYSSSDIETLAFPVRGQLYIGQKQVKFNDKPLGPGKYLRSFCLRQMPDREPIIGLLGEKKLQFEAFKAVIAKKYKTCSPLPQSANL